MGAPSDPETGKKSLHALEKETLAPLRGVSEPKANRIDSQRGADKAWKTEAQSACSSQEGLTWGCEGGTDLDHTKDLKSITLENSL